LKNWQFFRLTAAIHDQLSGRNLAPKKDSQVA